MKMASFISAGVCKLFAREPHKLLHTPVRVRGPNILTLSEHFGMFTFSQINTIFVNILIFHYWQNVFAAGCKWLRGPNGMAMRAKFVPWSVVRKPLVWCVVHTFTKQNVENSGKCGAIIEKVEQNVCIHINKWARVQLCAKPSTYLGPRT